MTQLIQELSLIWNILIFIGAAGLVWAGGVSLSRLADEIIETTGISEVFIGTLGLAVVTSLPEVATTLSATIADNPDLAVNNLFGSISIQITVLVVGDALIRNVSLSGILDNPVSRFQAICLAFLLSVAAIAILFKDYAFGHVGVWSLVLFGLYVLLFYGINYFKRMKWWLADPKERESIGKVKTIVSRRVEEIEAEKEQEPMAQQHQNSGERQSLVSVVLSKTGLLFLSSAAAILAGGYFVAISGEVVAESTGLGSSFMGFLFVGMSTSLPELSTTISAVRLQRYRMAFSNIFGTNLLNVGLILVVDVLHTEGSVLNEMDNFAAAGAVLGILLTTIYLLGLTIRFRKTFLRLGFDSILVLLFFVLGMVILFQMR